MPIDDLDHLLRSGLDRRRALGLLLGAGVVTAAACSSGGSPADGGAASSSSTRRASTSSSTASSSTAGGPGADTPAGTSTAAASGADCDTEIPEETAGPFPGDGSNGPDVLSLDGVVRDDIRSSFAGATGTAEGVDLTIQLNVVDVGTACAPVVGAAVYAWHCDRAGRYSMYSDGAEDENWLRGVAITDGSGTATFTSIFPGCYPGRWPHVHFEVYRDRAAATGGGRPLETSQLAFPREACDLAYTATGYSASVVNLRRLSLESDSVFGDDGAEHQIASMSGDAGRGFAAFLAAPIAR